MPETAFSGQSKMKSAYQAMRVIFTMVLSCVICMWLGNLLDDVLHTSPLCLLILLAYAIISSIYLMIRKLGKDE